jgi:hypothetical protein
MIPLKEDVPEYRLKEHNNSINELVKDCKDLITHLKQFKKSIKVIVPIKEQEVQYYKNFLDFLVKYEEVNTKKADGNFMALLSGDHKIDMKSKLTRLVILFYRFLFIFVI